MISDNELARLNKMADLYRAAFYLAKGAKKVGLNFLKKSGAKFDKIELDTEKQRLFWAEKILDKYISLKHLI